MSSNTRGYGPMGGGRNMAGEKAKDFTAAMKKLISYMKRYRIRLAVMMICAIAGTVFNIVGPRILGCSTAWWRK